MVSKGLVTDKLLLTHGFCDSCMCHYDATEYQRSGDSYKGIPVGSQVTLKGLNQDNIEFLRVICMS